MSTIILKQYSCTRTRASRGPNLRNAKLWQFPRSHNIHTFSSYLVTPEELHTALQKEVSSLPQKFKSLSPQPASQLSSSSPSSSPTSAKPPPPPRILPVSAAWFLPNDPYSRTGASSFLARRIPRSLFFDLDAVRDGKSPYPHMLPSSSLDFARAMRQLGVQHNDTVVLYDTAELGIFSAPRVAWTLRVFGHGGGVHVLNNFRTWVRDGFPIMSGEEGVKKVDVGYAIDTGADEQEQEDGEGYPAIEPNREMVASYEDVSSAIVEKTKNEADTHNQTTQLPNIILDARSYGRWQGTEPELRPGLSSGHMPSSASLPFGELLDPDTKAFLPASQLMDKLAGRYGCMDARSIISTCGTGVTAAVVDTALSVVGVPEGRKRVYDGSWTEWAQRAEPKNIVVDKSN